MLSTPMERVTLTFIVLSLLLVVSYRAYALFRNYLKVRNLGLPMIIMPVSMFDIGWLLVRKRFMWLQYLPFGLGRWVKYSYHGWILQDKTETHRTLGDAFIVVTPTTNVIWVADASASMEIVSKYKTWKKHEGMYSIFDIYGKNLVSSNYPDWQRHRKITGPAFRESNYKLLWDESRRQANGMIDLLLSTRPSSTLEAVRADYSLVSMHVLAAAEFGKIYDFKGGLSQVDNSHKLSYAAAMNTVLHNMLFVILHHRYHIPRFLQNQKFRDIKESMVELKEYFREAVEEQQGTSLAASSAAKGADLVSALVHANEAAKYEEKMTGIRSMHLSNDELFGNLFVFNLAGFETTAGTLTFATPWLAAYPEIQEWVREEVDAFVMKGGDVDYVDVFPKMTRTLAVMYETLRLYPPAIHLGRVVNDTEPMTLHLHTENRDILIPPKTMVSANIVAMQYDTKHWGADAGEWRPGRWIENPGAGLGDERLKGPPSELAGYMPWAVGPRVCPGKKFSQVEFIAVVSTILQRCRITPSIIPERHSTEQQARDELMEVGRDTIFRLTTNLNRPGDAAVKFVARNWG